MNKDMENTFNQMAELGGNKERLGRNTGPVINAPLRHKTPKPCGGCGATSERERCIGCLHDFGTQESAWVSTRPAPSATDTGLETVGYMVSHNAELGPVEDAVVYRSQAEELLTAERNRADANFDKAIEQGKRAADLEADNAALTARVKGLEQVNAKLCDDVIDYELKIAERDTSIKALEAKLAAAEMALEGLREKGRKVLDVLKAWEDDSDLVNSGKIVSDFRAVLGGKPS